MDPWSGPHRHSWVARSEEPPPPVKLSLLPLSLTAQSTISRLLVDGMVECYTLEDTVREQPGQPVSSWKIPGSTAIPSGTFEVQLLPSARFGRIMPHLVNVPGFDAIEI